MNEACRMQLSLRNGVTCGSNSRILEKTPHRVLAKPLQALTRSDHWLTQEMIRRFEGAKNPRDVKLNRDFVSTHQARVCAVLEKIPKGKVTNVVWPNFESYRLGPKSCWRSSRFQSVVHLRPVPPCRSQESLAIGNLFNLRDPWRKWSTTKRRLLLHEAVPIEEDKIDSEALWNPSEGELIDHGLYVGRFNHFT